MEHLNRRMHVDAAGYSYVLHRSQSWMVDQEFKVMLNIADGLMLALHL